MPNSDFAAQAFPFASFRLIFILILWTLLHAGCAMWPEPTRSAHVGGTGPGKLRRFFRIARRACSNG